MCATKTVAVVGAGWAGCSAAVELARRGHTVTLFEASRTLGGRARAVEFNSRVLDNGQHILLGAYSQTLAMMKRVGVDAATALLRLPLQMRYPPGSGGMDFIAARLPAPLHVGLALLRATGLTRADKLSLARFNTSARWMGWTLHLDCSVAELLARFDQTDNLIRLMWRPLCLAALNTPLEQASAQVFLAVLRDSLGARRQASDMLLPRVDLGTLFPVAAGHYIEQRGGTVRLGAKVSQLACDGQWQVNGAATFDAVVLATPASQSAHLLREVVGAAAAGAAAADAAAAGAAAADAAAAGAAAADAAAAGAAAADAAAAGAAAAVAQLEALTYEPIVTVYLQYDATLRLPLPMYALLDAAERGHWGQFVFDRGQLDAAQAGLLAVVVSAAKAATELEQGLLADAVAGQLAEALQLPALREPAWTRVIAEKRATFACTAGLLRPANDIGVPGLVLAGDYTASDYPATLESAVRSGLAAAQLL